MPPKSATAPPKKHNAACNSKPGTGCGNKAARRAHGDAPSALNGHFSVPPPPPLLDPLIMAVKWV